MATRLFGWPAPPSKYWSQSMPWPAPEKKHICKLGRKIKRSRK